MKKQRKVLHILAIGMIATGLAAPVAAQQVTGQSGNIVTIFGQEKIEKTDEGTVFHHFTEGLTLLPGGANSGSIFNGQDIIAWMYAAGKFETPKAGEKVAYTYPGSAESQAAYMSNMEREAARRGRAFNFKMPPLWTWSEIAVDSTGKFANPALRMSYLYTSYDSPKAQVALLETTGGTRTFVNGYPREGDHYDFGYTLTPVKLKKGLNEIIYTPGRFGRVESKLVAPEKPVMLTKRDMTLPDLITGENDEKWGAIRVVNATEGELKNLTIRATLVSGASATYKTDDIMPLTVRKVKFKLPVAGSAKQEGQHTVKLELIQGNRVVDVTEFSVRQVPGNVHHERTFISKIDGSVQYFSVAPALRQGNGYGEQKAMVLSVHGAGVEARNQARAYAQKEWVDVIAATNRRPYGFNWEEWGRTDALEVLEEAKRIFNPDQSKIYLTGHSMGGHGTWHLGTTFPDKFAAIAPCASYPDIIGYGRRGGEGAAAQDAAFPYFERGANGGRTLTLIHNLTQSGVYIFHGDADRVVATDQARQMREVLGKFHQDFCYYEYPGGEHWFGNESVDWDPIFHYFKWHSIPAYKDVKSIDFHTAAPNISANDYWVRVEQQQNPYEFTNVKAEIVGDTIKVTKTDNVALLVLDIPSLESTTNQIVIQIGETDSDIVTMHADKNKKLYLKSEKGAWKEVNGVNTDEKYSGRYGGFKNAFDNEVVLIYGTGGTPAEREWYANKARFDAETFYYRGNGSMEVIADKDYSPEKYKDRNVVLYGNGTTNKAWNILLKDAPVQVRKGEITVGHKKYTGDDLGTYFVYPNPYSKTASVGVVAGTGTAGMWATSPNNYVSGITGFPDLMVFRADVLRDGLQEMVAAGFFDTYWSLGSSDFVTK